MKQNTTTYHPASRPFLSKDDIEYFLMTTLGMDPKELFKPKQMDIVARIFDSEWGLVNHMEKGQTLKKETLRNWSHRDDTVRWDLRTQIIHELWTKKRLEDDDKIRIKSGGAVPKSGVQKGREAFYVIGLPASGKSGIAADIAEQYGAMIIDSDFAKRKLPEFDSHYYGASIVHAEASAITWGFGEGDDNPRDLQSLYELCLDEGRNIVIPTIGARPGTMIKAVESLQENSYVVHLILVTLPKREAVIRAVRRFQKTNRYVPLGLIFDEYANDPMLCYYYLQCKHADMFESMGVICTSERPPFCTDSINNSPAENFTRKDLILELP